MLEFISMESKKLEIYSKPPLTIEQQISLLRERGLNIDINIEQVKYYLTNVSYYHLSIYFKFFQLGNTFVEGTTFGDVLRIYTFDNKLRFLLLELLERIEKSFKSRVAYNLSLASNNSHCHTLQGLYRNKKQYSEVISLFTNEFSKSKEISIDHYRTKYSAPVLPPIWTTVEIISFGQVVKFVKSLTRQNQNLVARTLDEDAMYIMNWLHCLSVLRNTCAHHSRLWNRDQIFIVKTNHRKYEKYFENNKKLFNYLIVMQILLVKINPTSSWIDKLSALINEHQISVNHMGFPTDWEQKLRDLQ